MRTEELLNPSTARATQADIARLVHVSQSVVSAVLNGNYSTIRVSPAVRNRILQTAALVGYRPNSGARAMRTGLHHNIGYFLDTIPGFMAETDFPEFKAGVYDAAARHDCHVTVIRLPADNAAVHQSIPRAFREAHLDGLILNNMGGLTPEWQRAILTCGFPIVYLNEKHPTNAVYFEDYEDARWLTEYLIARGYRRLAYFSEPPINLRHYSDADRREGYLAAMRSRGLVPELKTWDPASPKTDIIQWLTSSSRPDVVLCSRDRDALVVQTCALAAGLRIPQDFALASASHEQRLFDYFIVPVTTMVQPRYDAARAAVDMLWDLIRNRASPSRPAKVFRAKLREGSTTPAIPT